MARTLGKVIKNLDMIFFRKLFLPSGGLRKFESFQLFIFSFHFIPFASSAGGLRNCNAAAFAS